MKARDVGLAAAGVGAIAIAALVMGTRDRAPEVRDARVEPIAPVPSERVGLVDAGPLKAAFAVEGGVDGALSHECMSLAAANRATVARAKSGGCAGQESELGCVTTPAGITWGYEVVMAKTTDDNTAPPDSGEWSDFQCQTEEQVRVVRVDGAGTRTAGKSETITRAWHATRSLAVRALADYDGDGEVEVLRELDGHDHEGGPVHEVTVLTFAKGAIGPYGPAERHAPVGVEDVDGDGRPDLVTRGPYGGVEMSDAFGNAWPAGPAMFVAHAKSDGTFALGDAESLAYTRAKCPARPALAFSRDDMVFAIGAQDTIVCARLRGVAKSEIDKQWNALCPATDGGSQLGMDCEDWPKELAAVAPPFALK